MSDSTAHDVSTLKEQETHAFKVSISKAGERDEVRPRTMDDLDIMTEAPLLNINIPSWRIGTPRFSVRGTPMIRGSSYAPTEDFRSSTMSGFNPYSTIANPSMPASSARKPSPLAVPGHHTSAVAERGASNLPSPRLPCPTRETLLSANRVIEPAMFTDLTLKPACDDRAVVRYSPSGAVTAATPSRLVAEITSPCFLDYELISDFFLTFRAFLEANALLQMLVARLRWALDRNDEVGMIVRVRTFVALRHWILNYFIDDFLVYHDLRVTFCNLLNDFVDELSQNTDGRRVQIRILAELKKCWRRVCAQYWDGAEFDDLLGPEVAITPGGIAGSRDPSLDPAALERDTVEGNGQRRPSRPSAEASPNANATPFYGEKIPKPLQVGDFVVLDNRPGTPEDQIGATFNFDQSPKSPHSLASMDVISCSFPSKSIRAFSPNTAQSMATHPVSSTAVGNASGPIATTPKALVGKRIRPTQTHKRNNSLSDSLRDHGSDKASSTDQEFLATVPPGGSLVRGGLLPPGHSFVDIESQTQYGHARRQTTIFQPKGRDLTKERTSGGAMSGYGMRKLMRSVRKALKSRGHGPYSNQTNLADIAGVGPRGATINRLPGTAVVPQQFNRHNGPRPPVRIDLLGAEVAEDFKKAIREEEEAVAAAAGGEARAASSLEPPKSAPLLTTYPEYSAARIESPTIDDLALAQRPRPVSDMAITVGSKSIVIVDDTAAFKMPSIDGQYGSGRPSVDTFSDSFVPHGTDPTPPNTPPEQSLGGGTPRRSSYLLNQHVIRPPLVEDILPPFIPDLATLEGSQSARVSEDQKRPSLSALRLGGRHPPLSGGTFRMHRRNRSSKTHQSLNSILHRRVTSQESTSVPPTIRSFDATTASGDLASVHQSEASMPAPLRVLRRRPGGDLKAATNVGDLDRSMLRRSHSVGSLATFTDSIRSSYMLSTRPNSAGEPDQPKGQMPSERAEVFSLGQLTQRPLKRDLSLFSTHSSKPIMRPSFEAEAQKLAQIPDDEDDGIESALLKLEGRFPKRPIKLSIIAQQADANSSTTVIQEGQPEDIATADNPDADADEANGEHEAKSLEPSSLYQLTDQFEQLQGATDAQDPPQTQHAVRALSSFLSETSRDSYYSIPLLERGLSDDASKLSPGAWTDRSILRGSDDEDSVDGLEENHEVIGSADAERSSFDLVEKTRSMERIKPGDTLPSITSGIEDESFLRDDSADDTDLSSEISEDECGSRESGKRDKHTLGHYLPTHPLADEPLVNGPRTASAQITLTQALSMAPEGYVAPINVDNVPKKPLPPTPELTPIVGCAESLGSIDNERPLSATKPVMTTNLKLSVHLPFILAFDSNTLAQQFTLIEKDALNEIDWKDLIDMNWKNSVSGNSRSWVDFLRNTDAQGVEVVIARFNIMVKWAISEIVLTQHVEERARCIIKLIHIAAHCRRYRNFATLAQLTIALSSNEVARLSKTWELVPGSDFKTLSDLELLVTPSRNFHNIREEMEIGTDSGCIPFVGIYTHDLLYNSQKPSEIASSPTTAPLVNFERCRIAASVVKTLLRLLEASTRYTFQPIEGVTERCLWIGALSDDDIRKHSQSLE
jgi:hypothetical protein